MTLDEFGKLVSAYGAAPERWPLEYREAARHLLASSAEARRIAAPEMRLDALLDAWQPGQKGEGQKAGQRAPADLDTLIATGVLAARAGLAPPRRARGTFAAPYLALLCAVVAGVAVGAVDLMDQVESGGIFDRLVTAVIFGEENSS